MYRQSEASSYNGLGVRFYRVRKLKDAEREFRSLSAIARELASKYPAVPGYVQELAATHNNLGAIHFDQQKYESAEETTRKP